MQLFVRVLATLLVVGLLVGFGAAIYNVGVDVGMIVAVQAAGASGDPVAVPLGYGYGYGPGPYWHGPGFFGIFFWILGIILIIAFVRAAVGWGHRGGPRGPGGWGDGRRSAMFEEMHRDLHRRDGPDGGQPASS